jgi:hypothetical protein
MAMAAFGFGVVEIVSRKGRKVRKETSQGAKPFKNVRGRNAPQQDYGEMPSAQCNFFAPFASFA